MLWVGICFGHEVVDSIIVFGSYLIHYIFGICTGAVFIAAKAPCSCAHCVPVDKKKKKNSFRFIIFYRNNNENGTIYFTNTFYFLGQPYTRARLIFLSRKIFFSFFYIFFFLATKYISTGSIIQNRTRFIDGRVHTNIWLFKVYPDDLSWSGHRTEGKKPGLADGMPRSRRKYISNFCGKSPIGRENVGRIDMISNVRYWF